MRRLCCSHASQKAASPSARRTAASWCSYHEHSMDGMGIPIRSRKAHAALNSRAASLKVPLRGSPDHLLEIIQYQPKLFVSQEVLDAFDEGPLAT